MSDAGLISQLKDLNKNIRDQNRILKDILHELRGGRDERRTKETTDKSDDEGSISS